MSTAGNQTPTSADAPHKSDEELAYRPQLEDDRAYEQQQRLLKAFQAPSWRRRLYISPASPASPTSSRSPAPNSSGLRRPGAPLRRTSEPSRPLWRDIVAQGSEWRLAPRFFPPPLIAGTQTPSLKKGISGLTCPVDEEMECSICAETRPSASFINTPGCRLKFCAECCKRHAEVKVLSSGAFHIRCPGPDDCRHEFDVVQCAALLSPHTFATLTRGADRGRHPRREQALLPVPRLLSAHGEAGRGCDRLRGSEPVRGVLGMPPWALLAVQRCVARGLDVCKHRAEVRNAAESGDAKQRALEEVAGVLGV